MSNFGSNSYFLESNDSLCKLLPTPTYVEREREQMGANTSESKPYEVSQEKPSSSIIKWPLSHDHLSTVHACLPALPGKLFSLPRPEEEIALFQSCSLIKKSDIIVSYAAVEVDFSSLRWLPPKKIYTSVALPPYQTD